MYLAPVLDVNKKLFPLIKSVNPVATLNLGETLAPTRNPVVVSFGELIPLVFSPVKYERD